jgi:branched-chain amino acid transport system permease protein
MLAQQLFNGLVVGSTYALFALGFTTMFGVLGVINLTYGFYFSAGALLALWITQTFGAPVWAALLLASIGAGLMGVVIDSLLLTRLRRARAPELASLMVTLGATLLLYSLASSFLGVEIRRFPQAALDSSSFDVEGVRVSVTQILIVAAAFILVAALVLLMRATRLGLGIRALAERPETAELMGVNTGAITRLVSFVSGCLGGAAGVLIGLNYNAIQPFMGEQMMLKGFAVIILGGLGDARGALVAGLIVGMLETLTAGYVASTWKDAVGFALLVLTLWVRPSGLFGRAAVKRA